MSINEIEGHQVPVTEVQDILYEARPALADDKYEVLQKLLDSYVAVLNLLSEKEASLARLRQLLGLDTTERLPPESSEEPSDEEPTSDEGHSKPQDEPSDSDLDKGAEGEDSEPADEEPSIDEPSGDPPKSSSGKGGRIPGSAYKADNTHIEHTDLTLGQTCPECSQGKLRLSRTTEPKVWLIGQAPVVAKSVTADTYRCSTCGESFTPELPKEADLKMQPSAVGVIIYLHYLAGMPFERLEVLQKEMGVPLPASVQWEKANEAAQQLTPLHEFLMERAAKAWLFHIDDSPIKVLELKGESRTRAVEEGLMNEDRTGVQTTGLIAFDVTGPPVALFFTGPQHAGENLALLLSHRPEELDKPLVMCDALNRNILAGLKDLVIEANCMAHGRRGVFRQLDSFPFEARYVLTELAKVFAVDAEARLNDLSHEERLRAHQRQSGPILGKLRKWIRIQLKDKRFEPNSEMGKALKYILRHWKKLTCFLRVAGAPVTNNLCERLLKTAIRYRKNSSFYKTLRGAAVGDLFMSLMQTARLSGVDPLHYMTSLLENADKVAENPAAWTPWSYQDTLEYCNAKPDDVRAA